MKPLLLCLLLVCLAPARAQVPKLDLPKVDVTVKRIDVDGRALYEVDAAGDVQAAPARVWSILTDYARMDEFVPDLESSKVLSSKGDESIIEQFGTARLLFMTKSIHLIVRASETPMSAIDITLVSGDMKHYEAHWRLVPLPDTGGTRIVYAGKLMPNFYVPGLVGAAMLRSDIGRMLGAVLARIDSKHD